MFRLQATHSDIVDGKAIAIFHEEATQGRQNRNGWWWFTQHDHIPLLHPRPMPANNRCGPIPDVGQPKLSTRPFPLCGLQTKVAEVRSRFEGEEGGVERFLEVTKRLGFDTRQMDRSNKMFLLAEFKKSGRKPERGVEFEAKVKPSPSLTCRFKGVRVCLSVVGLLSSHVSVCLEYLDRLR